MAVEVSSAPDNTMPPQQGAGGSPTGEPHAPQWGGPFAGRRPGGYPGGPPPPAGAAYVPGHPHGHPHFPPGYGHPPPHAHGQPGAFGGAIPLQTSSSPHHPYAPHAPPPGGSPTGPSRGNGNGSAGPSNPGASNNSSPTSNGYGGPPPPSYPPAYGFGGHGAPLPPYGYGYDHSYPHGSPSAQNPQSQPPPGHMHLRNANSPYRPNEAMSRRDSSGSASVNPSPPRAQSASPRSSPSTVNGGMQGITPPTNKLVADSMEVERLRANAMMELNPEDVKPIRTDFHFFVSNRKDEFLKKAEEEVRRSVRAGPNDRLDPCLVNTNLNSRLMKAWEDASEDDRSKFMDMEEQDRKRFMEEDEIASRHCATLTARGKSPRSSEKKGSPRSSPRSSPTRMDEEQDDEEKKRAHDESEGNLESPTKRNRKDK